MAEKIKELKTINGVTVLKYFDTYIKVKKVDIDKDTDPDRITRIDLNNLVAEIVTTPVLMNRWGSILVEVESELKKTKLDLEIFCAETKKKIRDEFTEKGEKYTVDKVEDALTLTPEYKTQKLALIEAEKNQELANSIYWAIKDKSSKLEKLSLTIQRDDILNMESTVLNGIKVVIRKME